MVRIVVTGASGFIGSQLRRRLERRGDEVVGLSLRDPAGPDPAAFDGADAVVHLAGERVAGRWTAGKRAAIRASRVDGTRRLVAAMAAAAAPPRVLVAASAIGYYGDRGDQELTEASPPADDFLAEVCTAWEAEALAAADHGIRVVRLRLGLVLGAGGGALPSLVRPTRLLAGGPLGSGRQWWSWVHVDDVCGLICHALDREVDGVANATAPAPVRQRELAQALGRQLHRPALLPAPAPALRLLLGGFAAELLDSRRVLPAAAERWGYAFAFPTLDAALSDLL